LALLVLSVILLALFIATWRRLGGLTRKWDYLLKDADGNGVLDLLERHLERAKLHEDRLLRLEMTAEDLDGRLRGSVRKVGVVKYDAFEDISGRQSFALALLDDESNGTVITSIVGRADSRVFAKELKERRAEVPLTSEETSAIAAAEKWQ